MGVFKKIIICRIGNINGNNSIHFSCAGGCGKFIKNSRLQKKMIQKNTIVGELVSERDEYTKYFRMSDGSTMAAQYEYPCIIKTIMTNGWNIIIHCLN